MLIFRALWEAFRGHCNAVFERSAQEAAAHAGAASPLGAVATQLYALHQAAGQGGADFSSIIRLIRGE